MFISGEGHHGLLDINGVLFIPQAANIKYQIYTYLIFHKYVPGYINMKITIEIFAKYAIIYCYQMEGKK